MRRPPPRLAESEPVETVVLSFTIPDDLLAWGRVPARAVTFPRDWARDIDQILATAGTGPLDARATETLLARVEGLVGEAVNAGRADLVLGLDTQLARWLYLQITVPTPRGPMRIGVTDRDTWSWEELAVVKRAHDAALEERDDATAGALVDAPLVADPAKMVDALWAAKALLLEAFPDARITDVVSDKPEAECSSCRGPLGSCTLLLESGTEYCASCWASRVREAAPPAPPAPTAKKRR